MKKRTINYPDLDLPCELCGRRFKTRQGLAGHRRLVHGSAGPEGPLPIFDKASPGGSARQSIKELKTEVEQLKLESEKRKLQAEFPSTADKQADLMEQSGLGAFTEESKTLAQKRAMGFTDQGQAPGLLDRLLSNPEATKAVIEGLRGILGTGHNVGDGTGELLKSLGFSLKDLIQGANSPKAGALSIAGVSLEGANLTPELLQGILQYKAAEVKAKADFEGRKEMADGLKNVLQLIGKGLGESMAKPGPGRNISQEIMDRQPQITDDIVTCAKCGHENKLPADLTPGMTIKCEGPGCDQVWSVYDEKAQPKPQRQARKREAKVQEPEPQTAICKCGQLINLDGKNIADQIQCPVCQEIMTVKSEDLAVAPEEPDPYGIRGQGRQFLHG